MKLITPLTQAIKVLTADTAKLTMIQVKEPQIPVRLWNDCPALLERPEMLDPLLPPYSNYS